MLVRWFGGWAVGDHCARACVRVLSRGGFDMALRALPLSIQRQGARGLGAWKPPLLFGCQNIELALEDMGRRPKMISPGIPSRTAEVVI